MVTIEDRNGMDLTEAEDTKKRWQEYTEEQYKRDLHDPDNHDGLITNLKPYILECHVKWALGCITTNKCTQYASRFGKLSRGCRTEKGQFSFQSQRRAMPKNVQITAQLHSSHTLVK